MKLNCKKGIHLVDQIHNSRGFGYWCVNCKLAVEGMPEYDGRVVNLGKSEWPILMQLKTIETPGYETILLKPKKQ